MKLSDYVAKFLSRQTRHIFVGNGGCIVHLLDSIDKLPRLKLVPCENEQAAAIAAEAYYRVSKKIGVAIATSGPGMANLIQGIACAYFDSIPSLFISGEPPVSHLRGNSKVRQAGFQEMDVVGLSRPITKYAVLLTDPKRVRYEMEKLIYLAFEGRPGPVMLDLPDDLQRADINPVKLESFKPPKKVYIVNDKIINKTLHFIRQSSRPVVIVGSGVKLGNAERELRAFLNKSGLPFATTWATIDMFLDDLPRLVGNFGVSSHRAGNFLIQSSDLIISLGSRLDTHQTGSRPGGFAPKARKIMVDVDDRELNKNNGLALDLKVNCDLKTFLKRLNSAKFETLPLGPWIKKIKSLREKYPICPKEYYEQKEKVNPYCFMNELSRETKKGDIIITDAGATLTWTMQAYKIRKPQALFSAFNHSPMGYALPASIGAKYAGAPRRVICIIGDGGMQMNIQELETIVYNKLPVKIFLINNAGYGIIKQTQDTWLKCRHVAADAASGLGFPDFQKVAKAYGIETMEISSHKDLNRLIRKALDYKGAILCDVKVRSGEKIIPKLEFGRPLEDLWPFLPKEELEEGMF